MIKVSVLGSGNIGTHLCKAFVNSKDILLIENYNRQGISIENCPVAVTNDLGSLQKADVYIVTFSDSALVEVSEILKHLDGIVVHTSGATPLEALSSFDQHGVIYPIQSIRKELPIDFKKVPIGVEGNTPTVTNTLKSIAKSISDHVELLDSQQRLQLHIAAVFANNFSNFMYIQAAQICKKSGIDFKMMLPLITNTIEKLTIATPEEVQTGPAVRNDLLTIEKHLSNIENEQQKELYKKVTEAIQNHNGKKL